MAARRAALVPSLRHAGSGCTVANVEESELKAQTTWERRTLPASLHAGVSDNTARCPAARVRSLLVQPVALTGVRVALTVIGLARRCGRHFQRSGDRGQDDVQGDAEARPPRRLRRQ
jgi:hypothetical protein